MPRALVRFMTEQGWAVHEPVLRSAAELVERHVRGDKASPETVSAIVEERETKAEEKRRLGGRPRGSKAQDDGYYLMGSVAVVPIEGVISKYASMINGSSQPEGTTTEAIVGSLRGAVADPKVSVILLDVDSPGGTVSGLSDVVAAVAEARKSKPVIAYAHDLMASAAYWIGSQAQEIHASPNAAVGSIGVYTLVEDTSEMWAKRGVKFHLVKAGAHKGIGVEGIPVTEGQLAVVQANVNAYYQAFRGDVQRGRGMGPDQIELVSDGRVHIGVDARTLGLVNGIAGFDELVARLDQQHSQPSPGAPRRGTFAHAARTEISMTLADLKAAHPELMAAHDREVAARVEAEQSAKMKGLETALAEAKAEKPATLAELKACIPEGTAGRSDLLVEAQEKGLSVNGALKLVNAKLGETATAQAKEIAELKALNGAGKTTAAVTAKPGDAEASIGALDANASDEQITAHAKKEWAANLNRCQSTFMSEAVYTKARIRDLKKARASA